MGSKDPFKWITEICQVSPSEESRLRRCSFFGQPDSDDSNSDSDSDWQNPPDIPVASNGITMVSPPESPEDEPPNDTDALSEDEEIFHTPPESRCNSTSVDNCNDDQMIGDGPDNDGETASTYADSAVSRRAFDLGRDTDLGFSEGEVDLTQRIEANSSPNGALRRESEEIRVSKRGFSPKGQSSTETPSKKWKSLDFELPSVHLGSPKKSSTEELQEWLDNWKFEINSPSRGASSELGLENQQNHESEAEVGEGSGRQRRLDFSTEVIDSEDEERNLESGKNNGEGSSGEKTLAFPTEERNSETETENGEGSSGRCKKSLEDINQFRDNGGDGLDSREMEEKPQKKRALPSWANWTTGRVGADERVEANEREPIQADTDSDSLSEDFEEISLLNVLMAMEKECEEDLSLECFSLWEVAERKWHIASSDK